VAAVLAGVAVARFAAFAGGGFASAAIAVVLVAVAVPFFAGRVAAAGPERHLTEEAVQMYNQLDSAVDQAAVAGRLFPCSTSYAAVNHTAQTALAWRLGVPLTHVLTVTYVNRSLRRPALAFFAPRNPITGGAPTRFVHRLRGRLVTRAGIWRVFRVTKVGDRRANLCVGPEPGQRKKISAALTAGRRTLYRPPAGTSVWTRGAPRGMPVVVSVPKP
jgi:hypothetical protein